MPTHKKHILAIIGSASPHSSNEKLVEHIAKTLSEDFIWTIFNELKSLPHFDPQASIDNPPTEVVAFRKAVAAADGLLICTPEYVYSIPSGLKNAIEWCISTTVFSDKPLGIITASAHGQKGHEELQLIMKTVMCNFTEETTLLIPGIKAKVNEQGEITDEPTQNRLNHFLKAFTASLS